MYYLSIIIVILSSVLYHVSQKSISSTISPFLSMIVTYIAALVMSIGCYMLSPNKNFLTQIKEINWASYLLALCIFGIEIGFLLVYRSGWQIKTASLFANGITAVVLIVIGVMFYKEHISLTNGLGIALCIIGLVLLNK